MNATHRILTIAAAIGLIGSNWVSAQGGYFIARYQVGFPAGETKQYIDQNSWAGFTMGYRYMPNSKFAVGGDVAWQTFNKKNNYDTYVQGTASISGVQFRYQNMFEFSAQGEMVLNDGGDFRPYIGLGVGGLYVRRETTFGLFEIDQDPTQFMVKPGIGFSYYMNEGTALIVGTEYVAGFKNNDLDGQSFVALNIGLIFRSH